jgi:hypothetical protein
MQAPAKSTQSLPWTTFTDEQTGWEVLRIPGSGTYMRDWENHFYYISQIFPKTWTQIPDDDEDVVKLEKKFRHAYGY